MTHGPSHRRTGPTGAAPARRRRLALLGLAAVVALLGASCKYLDPANRASAVPGATNGQLPLSYLDAVGSCTVYDEAAPSLRAMIDQAAVDGIRLRPTSCYRDYAGQVAARDYWCGLGACQMAATPGTSNHGWGKAVDLGDENGTLTFDSPAYEWMLTWGWYYGWVQPASMKQDGTIPEAWHFEWLGDGGRMYPGEYWGLGTAPPTEPRGLPMGSLDEAAGSPGSILVRGWAIDPDQVASIPVRVRVDGQVLATVQANAPRPDVAAAFPLYAAADHGYQTSVAVAPGPHAVCVDAVNVSGAGWDRELGCADLVVP